MNTAQVKNCPRETPLYGRLCAILRRIEENKRDKGAILHNKNSNLLQYN
jgi:hypothetical protein